MKSFLDHASRNYYSGTPIITDEEFDFLAKQYNYTSVGYAVTDAYPHAYRMYSLQKFLSEDVPSDLSGWIESPKFDGAAVSILYINGELQLALTRGDGIEGKDITENIKWLVPTYIKHPGITQVTGEVCAYKSVKNARNYAAGALGLKDPMEFGERDLTFIAYDLFTDATPYSTWTIAMKYLAGQGIDTAYTTVHADMYPHDGVVWRLNNYEQFENMGYTSHHPRGAFAVKEEQIPVRTILRNVTWQLGKSGVVSPVGHFDPIEIGGATIRKATLHNMDYIDALNLELGCAIGVIRSGEIIPRVVGRYDD
jgi:DNA ligase (NAD+)